jgi:hypothetical protein
MTGDPTSEVAAPSSAAVEPDGTRSATITALLVIAVVAGPLGLGILRARRVSIGGPLYVPQQWHTPSL